MTPGNPGDRFNVHQVFYDRQTRLELDEGFIPLDNTRNERPDWYEFWVIRNYLKEHELAQDSWYGFLSPRFGLKTGLRSAAVLNALRAHDSRADVALFSADWDQLAYFLNPFEQGERWHPGLMALSQRFLDEAGIALDLATLVTHSLTSVFGNYVIAKPAYWREWLSLADRFFDFVEGERGGALGFKAATDYGSAAHQAPMKTFIQERLSSVILSRGNYRVFSPDRSYAAPLLESLFHDDLPTRRQLQACELLKRNYCLTGDAEYLSVYWKIRGAIRTKQPPSR